MVNKMMNDWILLTHCEYDKSGIKKDIKRKSNEGELYLTILVETQHGSFHTVTAAYFNDDGEELYMLEHPSFNLTLDDVKRYSVLRAF